MGLLDTWNEWKQDLSPYAEKAKDKIYGEKMSVQPGQDDMRRTEQGYLDQSLKYAGGKIDEAQEAGAQYFQGEKVFDPATGGPTKRTGAYSSQSMKDLETGLEKTSEYFHKGTKYAANKIEEKFGIMFPELAGKKVSKNEKKTLMDLRKDGKVDHGLIQGLKERNSPVNEKDIGTLEKLTGTSFADAKANWKDKGGMEGLMSNPAFSLGLALMQSSANGKTINQGILDNFVKSAKISEHYKDRIKANAGGVIEATEPQMNKIKGILENSFNISKPQLRRLLPGNQSEQYEQAVEDIVFKVQKKVNTMKKAADKSGKSIEVGTKLYKKVIQQMIDNGEIDKKGGLKIFGYDVSNQTIEGKAQGGPVQQGKPYLVGEQGPEIIIPHSSGDVLTNDDSQIYAMLLASNPQLQKVSRVRAQKIMRNRFPEYFEG
jgi:hypothetical protein